jgi:hypothetical protein
MNAADQAIEEIRAVRHRISTNTATTSRNISPAYAPKKSSTRPN